MKNLKSMGLLMGVLLCAAVFYACVQEGPGEAGRLSIVPPLENGESNGDDGVPSLENGGSNENDGGESAPKLVANYVVSLKLTNAASISTLGKTFTPEDFPEVPLCTKFSGSTGAVANSAFEKYQKEGKEAEYRRSFSFRAWTQSRAQMVEVLRLLNEREDVESASGDLTLKWELACERRGIEIVDAATKQQIQQALWDDLVKRINLNVEKTTVTKEEQFPMRHYYGTYNGYVTTAMGIDSMSGDGLPWHETIDGIEFWDPIFTVGIVVWKDGILYDLKALYEQGLLAREYLLAIKAAQRRVWDAMVEEGC